MNRYPKQDKSNQWIEKVQMTRNDFNERELTVISWKNNRTLIPIETVDGHQRDSQANEQFEK